MHIERETALALLLPTSTAFLNPTGPTHTVLVAASPPIFVPYYNYYNRYSRPTQLGDFYEETLGLQRKEVTWLNKFPAPSHAFMQIEVAVEATVRLYVAVMNDLEQRCKKAGSTLPKQVKELEESTEYTYNYRNYRYVDRHSAGHKVGASVYLTVFNRCESAVRERFAFKPFDTDIYFTERNDPDRLFNQYFGDVVQAQLPALVGTMPLPNADMEQAMNQADPARWQSYFELLLARLPADPTGFTAGVYDLGRANDRNPNVSTIYLEASRKLGALDREATIHLYLYYLYYGSRRYPFKPKPFLKRMQKALFPLPENLARFEDLSLVFLHNRDLVAAAAAVPGIYYKERKKIELNPGAVQIAQQQHAGTVQLLNEYLQDEPEPATPAAALNALVAPPKAAQRPARPAGSVTKKAPKVAPVPKTPAPTAVTFVPGLALNAIQQELLHHFFALNLALPQTAVEAFAQRHGSLRNQLIDSLNEACYELLNDVLIEESSDGYTIYQPHYQKITA